jgi:hypothetical protein
LPQKPMAKGSGASVWPKPGETVYFCNYIVGIMGRIFEVAENQGTDGGLLVG